MKFSVIIPAFNRGYCVNRAIKSALEFFATDDSFEIIVVDDGSTDDTVLEVEKILIREQKKHNIKLIKHLTNKGVCAAKNTGARAAIGEWIIFLDSDDELIVKSYAELVVSLETYGWSSIHFFSCIEEGQVDVSTSNDVAVRNFNQYLRFGTNGEKLPIISRLVFNEFPYDEDMPGYESLSYMRIIKKYKCACIHSLVARRYYTTHQDRLSSVSNLKKRSAALAKGHYRVLEEHFDRMSTENIIRQFLKCIKSLIRSKF